MPIQKPIYDPALSYEENWNKGPFGEFRNDQTYQMQGEPCYEFLGHKIYLPLGVPAGPLPNKKFIEAAFKKGFDLPTYKTVRTRFKASHPKPNIIPVKVINNLTLEKAAEGLITENDFYSPIAITNSFGVGSFDPDIWQPDMKKAVESAKKGQVMIASGQGTSGNGKKALIEDYVLVSRLMKEAGAKIIELNLSCPNEGKAKLLCHDIDMVEKITFACKNKLGNTPILIKLAYFKSDDFLHEYLKRIGKIVDGFVSINTIPAEVRTINGEQALPGDGRLRTDICGAPIKWAGLEMVERMKKARQDLKLNFTIVGCGGLTTPSDYKEYMNKGANACMSATGMMWNPWLAREIKESISN